ncbi:MAG: diguanylate cyclase [Proteobacteria bacterium]|nr:diguanylate cyclase [Pseudomonadota bacterium]
MHADFAHAVTRQVADAERRPAFDMAASAEAAGHLLTVARTIMQSDVSVMVTSTQGTIEFVNPAFERHSGYPANEALGRTPGLLNAGEHSAEFFSSLKKTLGAGKVFRAIFTNRRRDGDLYHEDKMITPIRDADAKISHYVATGRLLTPPAGRLADGADDYDALTGIPNRRRFMDQLGKTIVRCQRNSGRFSLLHVDLDRFRLINDTLGHTTGDRVLAAVAQRLAALLDEQAVIARLGGDGFTIIVEHRAKHDAVSRLAEDLIAACSRPVEIDSRALYAEVSIGIASFPQDGQDIDSLVRHAEIAMYQAKSAGRGRFVNFSAPMERKMLDDLSIEASLRSALHHGEFEICYQPIVSPGDRRAVALEALLRWHSPQHGEVSPGRFIPLLEEIGLIVEIGRWVLETACAQFKSLQKNEFAPAILAVNLSAAQFRDAQLIGDIKAVLQASGLAPEQLELEITESILIEDASAATKTLNSLAALGVRLAIDDFGTGYSSLSYLRRFPINTLKIDRSFVTEMESSVDAEVIVKAIVNLAHNLGMTVVAEGVESAGQLARLSALGCAKVQGFLFSRALPIDDLPRLLANPFAHADDAAHRAMSLPLPPSLISIHAPEPTMKTIFLVDDSATILLSISSILGKAGYTVEKAANAEEALKRFKAGAKIDLLLTDLNMPGMNGIELIREVRKLAAYRFVPILFLTTESQQAKKVEAKAAGASGWIVKPATADELLSTIKLVIR